ncbi:MAG: type II/IV secretion system ATPase subunit, partial [Candidatus Hadarchaeales archaeon]
MTKRRLKGKSRSFHRIRRVKRRRKTRRRIIHIRPYDFEEELLRALRRSRSGKTVRFRGMTFSRAALERIARDGAAMDLARSLGKKTVAPEKVTFEKEALARALAGAVEEEGIEFETVKETPVPRPDKSALAVDIERALEEEPLKIKEKVPEKVKPVKEKPPHELTKKELARAIERGVEEEPPVKIPSKRTVKTEKPKPAVELERKKELARAIEHGIEEPPVKIPGKRPEKVETPIEPALPVKPAREEMSKRALARAIEGQIEEEPEAAMKKAAGVKPRSVLREHVVTGAVAEKTARAAEIETAEETSAEAEEEVAPEEEPELPEEREVVVERPVSGERAPGVTVISGGAKPGAGKIVYEKIPVKEVEPLPKKGAELDRAIKEIVTKKKIKIEEAKPAELKLEGFPPYDPKIHGPITKPEPIEGFQSVEEYWVDEPFAYVQIMQNPKTRERLYCLVEPKLDENEKKLAEQIVEHLKARLSLEELMGSREKVLSTKIYEFITKSKIKISPLTAYKLYYEIRRECFGLKGIDALMKDPNIEDISCNGLDVPVYIYHRKYYSTPTNIVFRDEEVLNSIVINLVERSGKMISFGKPTVDATLPDGSRLQATLGREITTRGSTFTIRKFAKEPFTPIHLLKNKTYSAEMLAYLWLAVENKNNILIIGETASGKTSTLNAMALFIPPDAKIVSLEETRELTLYQPNWIPSVTRGTIGEGGGGITLYDLLLQAMRQRPECIVVGEVRGKEGLTLFQAMSTGHTSYSTLHASSIEEAINRLEGAPINIPHN